MNLAGSIRFQARVVSTLVFLFLSAMLSSLRADWQEGTWQRVALTVQTNQIDSDLTNFPVLVQLDADNFDFSEAQADGDDVRFTTDEPGLNLLDFERGMHDSNETSVVRYVLPQTLAVSSNDFDSLGASFAVTGDNIGYDVDGTEVYAEDGAGRLTTEGTGNSAEGEVRFTDVDLTGKVALTFWFKGDVINNEFSRPSVKIGDTEVWAVTPGDNTDYPWQRILIDVSEYSGDHDIVFVFKTDGTSFDYRRFWFDKIQLWENTVGYAEYWVRLPEVSSTEDTTLYMWYGMPTADDVSNATGVWDSAEAVWHKNDGPDQAILDSTSNGRHGVKYQNDRPVQTNGIAGYAQYYEGAVAGSDNQMDDVEVDDFDYGPTFTLSFWFNMDHFTGPFDYIFSHGTVSEPNSLNVYFSDDPYLRANLSDSSGNPGTDALDINEHLADGVWHHYAVTVDGSGTAVFLDGVQEKTAGGGGSYNPSGNLFMGGREDGDKDRYYPGYMDEVRISSVARTAAWIKAEYANGADYDNFLLHGTAEEVAFDSDLPSIATDSPTGIHTNRATLNGTLAVAGSTDPTVRVYWGDGADRGTNVTDWSAGDVNDFGPFDASGEVPTNYAHEAKGLTDGTQYTYRYYATNDAGEVWGAAQSFTTLEVPGIPTIDAPSETGFVHVVISGAVTGGNPDPLAWFCLKAGADGGTGSTGDWGIVESAGVQSGAFTNMITGLQDDTNYYARVYVTNEAGAAWSDPVSFSTEATPAQLTLEADQVIDGEAPSIEFKEAPGSPLNGIGASPDWLYDFAYYGGVQTVDLDAYTLKATGTPSSVGTISFNMAGASLVGANALGIRTYKGTEKQHGHHVVITNVNEIAIGGIDTHQEKTSGGDSERDSGDIVIGSSAAPAAGGIQIGYLHTYTGGGNGGNVGDITIYGDGDVLITDGATAGDILASVSDTDDFRGGDVYITHDGDFLVRNMETWTRNAAGGSGASHRSGNITLDGGSAVGDAVVEGYIKPMNENQVNNESQSFVEFKNYKNVIIQGDVLAQHKSGDSERSTDLTITNNITGDIDIQGAINLWASAVPANNGRLDLACDGSITLATLSLGKVQYAALGAATNFIEGVIYGTDGDYLAGDGTDLSNAAGDSLRASSNSVVYYNPTVNPALQGATYTLADLDGNEGDGGTFEPAPTTPFIAAAHQDLTETSVELVGTLSSTGTSATTVSVYWGSEDGGTDTWANTNTWAAHTDSDPLPLDYTNALAGLTAGQDLYYCFAASNAGGKVWTPVESVVMEWSGDTLTIAGDQIVDDESDPLSFVEIPGVLNAKGEFNSGATTYPPWTYEFADVYLGPGRVLDLSTNKLYCATQNGQRADVALDLNGANLSGESGTNISTYISSGNYSDIVVISNVADIAMGGIDAHGRNTSGDFSTFAGGIEIGTASQPAGSIRVDFLWAFSTGGRSSAGPITVYGNGDVHIENSTGEPGDIDTSSQALNSSSIFVEHQGELRVRDILDDTTGTSSGGSRAGDITLNGGDASGDATIRNINASITGGNYGGGSKHTITISDYRDVTISNIVATGWYDYADDGKGRHAANVVMEDIGGDITINGEVDLYADNHETRTGNIQLSCTGTVTLAELDLDRMLYAALSSGSGESRITGVVTNFDATSTGGSGTQSDPYTTAETRLRAPEGQVVYYEYSAGSLNTDLGGDVWQLRNLDDSGDGGLLMVEPPSGTVIMIR